MVARLFKQGHEHGLDGLALVNDRLCADLEETNVLV